MKKNFLILISILLLTGCGLDYEISFNDEGISENIIATFDSDIYEVASSVDGDGFYLEKELVENEVPAFADYSNYYKKTIDVNDNKSVVNLKYNYSYDEFENAYFLERCFEDVYVNNTDEYIYVSLGGKFDCFYDNDVKIKLSTEYNMTSHNADNYKDGYYIWDLKMIDDEVDINFLLLKEKTTKKSSSGAGNIILLVFLLVVTAGLIFFIKRYAKRED